MGNHRFRQTQFGLLSSILVAVVLLNGCGGGSSQNPDPIVQDLPIAYVKRPIPVDNNGNPVQIDVREALTFNEGGDLYVRDRASAIAPEKNITGSITGGLGDVKHLSVSYDGTKLLFSLRLEDTNGNAPPTPSWNIFEYEFATGTVKRIIQSDFTAELGDDIMPIYLPDGRILFSSTRHQNTDFTKDLKGDFFPQDEDLREPAFTLHTIEIGADGFGDPGTIKQISFNQSHDLFPSIIKSGPLAGKILFSRWNNAGAQNEISLYTINPDGTGLQAYYGAHSHNTGTNNSTIQFLQPQQIANGSIISLAQPFTGGFGGGTIININGEQYADNTQPVWLYQGVLTGPAQSQVTSLNVTTNGTPSPGGRYSSLFTMSDGTGRLLVSWSPCRLYEDPLDTTSRIVPCNTTNLAAATILEAPPLYGVFIYDPGTNTQLPIVIPAEGIMFTDIVAAYPGDRPPVIFDKIPGVDPELDQNMANQGVGALHIRSVYDFDGTFNGMGATATSISELADPKLTTADQRPARFLRIIQAAAIPDTQVLDFVDRNAAFGASGTQGGMREIIGYAPIEPDGSVKVKVPADTPFTISVVDKNGLRLSNRHNYWLQVRPGETLECNGCHNHASGLPHGRPDNSPVLNTGAVTTGLPFPNSDATLWAEMGETMAETRMRHDCAANVNCPAMTPSENLNYVDYWTDPAPTAANRPADASYSISYTDPSFTTQSPVYDNPISSGCGSNPLLQMPCKIVINYETDIQPLWEKMRGANACIDCHNSGTGFPHLNAGQLELTRLPSADEPNQFRSYRELLFPDDGEFDNGGTLSLITTTQLVLDANGNTVDLNPMDGIPDTVNVPDPAAQVSPSMSSNGTRANVRFMELMTGLDINGDAMTPTDTVNHATMMSAAELRMVSEWLDLGAQYFNNPFEAPAN